eukprot:6194179-Pleurochrysis_carterae.AAC.1
MVKKSFFSRQRPADTRSSSSTPMPVPELPPMALKVRAPCDLTQPTPVRCLRKTLSVRPTNSLLVERGVGALVSAQEIGQTAVIAQVGGGAERCATRGNAETDALRDNADAAVCLAGVSGGANAATRSMAACAASATTGWQAVGARADDVNSAGVRIADVGRSGANTHHATHSVTTNLNAFMRRSANTRARA